MAKTRDFTSILKDATGAFPIETVASRVAFKTSASVNEKLSGVALKAAEKSAEISSKWTKDTISKLANASKAKAEPADYAKAATAFVSDAAEVAAENMAAFAEIAKNAQMNTIEVLMASCKGMTEETNAITKNAANKVTGAATKVSAAK